MKSLYVFQHIPCEGPGRLLDFAKVHGIPLRMIHLMEGDSLPEDYDCAALVVLGGSMNVDEEELYPWLKPETAYIREAVGRNVPVLGLCLGGQLLAKAMGGRVTQNGRKEIGNFKVVLTPAGELDPLFTDFPRCYPVFQWHGDTFSSLGEGKLLASSEWCAHQAFRIGTHAYGLQFHVEVTAEMAASWLTEYNQELIAEGLDPAPILAEFKERENEYAQLAERLFHNFFKIASII
jgi:GMP synthase (glutamine-hydrolysing)